MASIAELYRPSPDIYHGTMELFEEAKAMRSPCLECGSPEGKLAFNLTASLIDAYRGKGKQFFCDECLEVLNKLAEALPIRADLYKKELNALYARLKEIADLGPDRYKKV